MAHGAVQRELLALLEEQGEHPSREDEGLFAHCAEGSRHRPDLVWQDRVTGVPHAIDVVTVGAQGQRCDGRAESAELGERAKEVSYASCLAQTPGVQLVPFGIDSFGGLGPRVRDFLGLVSQLRL